VQLSPSILRALADGDLAAANLAAPVPLGAYFISPDNLASRALVSQYGFVEVGEQWDDEDGLETIFEAPARVARRASR